MAGRLAGGNGGHLKFEHLEGRLLLSGTIEGQVWHDVNADGQRDAGEVGLNDWTVELTNVATSDVWTAVTGDRDLNGDSQIDPVTERGIYSVDELVPGSYEVAQTDRDGWARNLSQ